MKKLIAIAVCALMVSLLGCATLQSNSAKTLATTAQTVDAAMQGWASWVVLDQATDEQEAKVRAAYTKYQLAMGVARNAYTISTKTGDTTAWKAAAEALLASKNDLLNLVAEFQK